MEQPTEKNELFAQQVCAMFGAIAPRYDFLNCLLSAGRDRVWRKLAVDALAPRPGGHYLDVATGTGDVALEIARRQPGDVHVTGLDCSVPMLDLARKKIQRRGLRDAMELIEGSAEALPFPDGGFQGVTTAFGVRNFADMEQGLAEMLRVLEPGGRLVVLEFSMPRNLLMRFAYRLYFDHVLPRIGRFFSRHPEAYQYLPDSVSRFPVRSEFARVLERTGFKDVQYRDLTLGIVTLYSGVRPAQAGTEPSEGI